MPFSTQQMKILNLNLETFTYYVKFTYLLVIKNPASSKTQSDLQCNNVCVVFMGHAIESESSFGQGMYCIPEWSEGRDPFTPFKYTVHVLTTLTLYFN